MKKLLLILFLLIPGGAQATDPIIEGLDMLKISQKDLSQVAHWKRTPTVVLCQHAPVERKEVKSALGWWTERGYLFYHSIYLRGKRADEVCKSPDPTGYILIHLVTQETFDPGDNLAVTHFYVDNDTREIHWAKIFLKPNVQERVLEHELGHALGWMHTKQLGHLMHEKLIYGGWKDNGLKKD
jgi:hypothetical protein